MSELSFTNFDDYNNKLESYLKKEKISKQFEECKIEGVKEMINKFDFATYKDVNQLAFLVWMSIGKYEVLLNDGYLMSKIDLDMFGKKILELTPKIVITDYGALTPLRSPRGPSEHQTAQTAQTTQTTQSSHFIGKTSKDVEGALPYYNCIKFIGQFTNSQKIYNKCLQILEAMPQKLIGSILSPPEIMCLMSYNKNVDVSNNKYKQLTNLVDKMHSFYNSAYTLNPSYKKEYNRYRKNIQEAYYDIAYTKGNYYGYVCLINEIANSHWSVINNTDQINFYIKINIPEKAHELIKFILICISKQQGMINEEVKKNVSDKIKKKIEDKLQFISKDDENEIKDIFNNTCIHVTDDKCDKEIFRKNLLIELYERDIVNPDSKLSHNLMRCAVKNGILWIVKYLVEKGCPTKILPAYGKYEWMTESQQLKGILNEEIKDPHGFGKQWIDNRKKARENVFEYLIHNSFI